MQSSYFLGEEILAKRLTDCAESFILEGKMDKIIIKCCLNGERGRKENPHVPWTPQEVAAEAKRAYDAGASIVHFHARTLDGGVSQSVEWYAEADQLIRARCPLVLNHTTARTPDQSIEAVIRHLRETPQPVDMVSVNFGYLIDFSPHPTSGGRRTIVTPNSYDDICQLLAACYERRIFPEPALFDNGFLNIIMALAQDNVLRDTHYFLLEFADEYGSGTQWMPGTPKNYLHLTESVLQCFPDAIWITHGIESTVFPIAAMAVITGMHVRIGFEDGTRLLDGRQAYSNGELVEWVAKLARAYGREPATPVEARQILTLPDRPQ